MKGLLLGESVHVSVGYPVLGRVAWCVSHMGPVCWGLVSID